MDALVFIVVAVAIATVIAYKKSPKAKGLIDEAISNIKSKLSRS